MSNARAPRDRMRNGEKAMPLERETFTWRHKVEVCTHTAKTLKTVLIVLAEHSACGIRSVCRESRRTSKGLREKCEGSETWWNLIHFHAKKTRYPMLFKSLLIIPWGSSNL